VRIFRKRAKTKKMGVLSGRIWTVGHCTGRHRLAVLSLSLLRDVRMMSDRIQITVVPSVLAGSVRREQARLARLDLSPFLPRVGTVEWS
jgi:hypothetical protein